MYRFWILGILAIVTHYVNGQFKIHPLLQSKLQQTVPEEYIKIRIEFKENFAILEEKNRLTNAQLSVRERTKQLTKGMAQHAKLSQKNTLDYLRSQNNRVRNIQNFWITNVVFCEMQNSIIADLALLPDVKCLYYENNRFELGDSYTQEEHIDLRGPGGTEASIEACNVRPLWDLGYTGRGRKVFVYDTGVWPTHPSFAERFMGNHSFLNEAWYGYYHNEPNGERNSHGTHVLGTMLGLDKNTADSIGIAMNAYWIANDHVGPTISVMPDLPYLMAAYQWALNPDNDLNTSDDIPDVINNSFRWYDGADQEQCEGIVKDLMIAIEAAGIANIYSGGNQGPSNTTISAPQRINISEVNTFSVGSINGNSPFPHPLSSFSSLGPKQCPGAGSLSIHPEVVAPGQNVRSAWAQNEYNTISGTSMASPHVSGVVLLLKEAFPALSGEEILWAIYLTAIDMGAPGEDNTFGMGMIDAHAAFLYLSENHTPVNPNNITYDLSVESVNGIIMNGTYCENNFSLSVTLKNKGNETIESFSVSYNLMDNAPQIQNWSGLLSPGQQVTLDLGNVSTAFSGQQEFIVKANLTGQLEYYDLVNNTRHVRWNVRPTLSVPFIEEFENSWNNGLWLVNNPDASYSWRTTTAPLHHAENKAAAIQLSNYSPASNQRDELQSPLFLLPANGNIQCDWDLSYRRRSGIASHQDTMHVMIQLGCDGSRDTLATLSGENLAVVASAYPNFVPQNSGDWKKLNFDLNNYLGQEVQLIFESVNRAGNHIYIDNFRIFESMNPPLALPDVIGHELIIYPNPGKEKFVFEIKNFQLYTPYKVQIYNVLGQKMEEFSMNGEKYLLDFSNQPSGIYFVLFENDQNSILNRIVKQ